MVNTRRTASTRDPVEERNPEGVVTMTKDQFDQVVQQAIDAALRSATMQPPSAPVGMAAPGRRRPSPIGEESAPERSTNRNPLPEAEDSSESHAGEDTRKRKAPVNRAADPPNIPFARVILDQEVPRHFRPPQVGEYDGSTDPEDHLNRFENACLLHQYADGIKCRLFLNTLSGLAQRWFNKLAGSSIKSFQDFREVFLHQFASSRKHQKTSLHLFTMKQKPKETLRAYLHRFNQEACEVPSTPSDVLTSAFTQGLLEGDFFRSLVKKPPASYQKLSERATKYIQLEETQLARRGSHPTAPPVERRAAPPPPAREVPTRPLQNPPAHRNERVVQAIGNLPQLPEPGVAGQPGQPARYCAYHRSTGHTTNECRHLTDEINRIIRERQRQGGRRLMREDQRRQGGPRRPNPQQGGGRQHPPGEERVPAPENNQGEPRPGQEPPQEIHPDPQEDRNNLAHRGEISMIAGGATDGDSNRARKAHGRRLETYSVNTGRRADLGPNISFGPQDLEGVDTPHDDALVIRATIANYDVARVFVDTGSSVNVLYKEAFDRMQLDEGDLQPLATSLFGFSGHEVQPLGQIRLPLSLGKEPLRRTRATLFTVVEAPSAYNVILGRPALSSFGAVVSTYHQKLKFPVHNQVGSVGGDQNIARKCYIDMVQTDLRAVRRRLGTEVNSVQEASLPRPKPEKVPARIVPGKPDQITYIAADLPVEIQGPLLTCLTANRDIFAWSPLEVTGVAPTIMEHRLNVTSEARPVRQKRRHFSADQDRVIREETDKLLKAGQIREIQFPTWLANVVLVPKPGGKWRVCIDFRDLNKACPKDCYPLPRIDQLIIMGSIV
ncbi:uncharacterized protein LOC141847563 [Curcuma longa]|uniref:uncharacterized protein LOC141847563 n=1 Tax=Curcuma longa TaxID=136217 RepID=UPI003D9F2BA8